jgi:hypothetical protein
MLVATPEGGSYLYLYSRLWTQIWRHNGLSFGGRSRLPQVCFLDSSFTFERFNQTNSNYNAEVIEILATLSVNALRNSRSQTPLMKRLPKSRMRLAPRKDRHEALCSQLHEVKRIATDEAFQQ